jgi:hypothetical protein
MYRLEQQRTWPGGSVTMESDATLSCLGQSIPALDRRFRIDRNKVWIQRPSLNLSEFPPSDTSLYIHIHGIGLGGC